MAMVSVTLTPLERVRRAIIELQSEQPFFAHLSMALTLVPVQKDDPLAKSIQTAGVNVLGELAFNEEWVAGIPRDKMKGLLAHEVLHCLTPETIVGGTDAEIVNVESGDGVVCADGRMHAAEVVKSRNYDGEVIELKAQGMLPFKITPNHRVLRVQMRGWKTRDDGKERWNERILSNMEWVDAGEIREGDFLIMPKLKSSSRKRMISFKKYVYGNEWSVSPQLMKGVALTKEVAFFIGRFIADGYTDKHPDSSNIGLAFNKRKKADGEQILKMLNREFGIGARLMWEKKTLQEEGVWRIYAGNSVLRRFLREEIGTYAHNKLMPEWIVNHKDINIVKAALQGLFGGDGWIGKTVIGFCTVNRAQAVRIQRMLTRINVVGKIYVRNEEHKSVNIFGKLMSASSRTQYIMQMRDKEIFELMGKKRVFSKRKTYHYIDLGDSFGVKVTSTKRKKYVGAVYNLRTSEENYTANNMVVHNCAFDHLGRLGGRNVEVSNIAMDMVVNMMVERSNMVLPDGTIPVDTREDTASIQTPKGVITVAKVSERWWEDIYNELVKELDKKGLVHWVPDMKGKEHCGRDVHQHGAPGPGRKEPTPAEKEDAAAKWRQRLAEAATIAKQQGKTPGGMERFIDGMLQPKVNWREMLRMYLKPHLYPTDFSYAKPHKKSQLLGVYLPDTVKESKEVEVLVDTSGSIGEDDLRAFMGEMAGIATSSAHVTMTVSFCDTQLYEDARYKMEGANIKKLLAMTPKGGGGTQMENGLDWVKAHSRTVPVVIVLTDGCDSYNRTRKSYPFEVIWCVSSSGVNIHDWSSGPSYGRRVKM
jgi:predicted metal-dependent peptidase/intein/homing endonuclease